MPATALRTLVVDDHTVFAEMLSDRLREAGYVVAGIAPSRERALAAARESKFDLVICDVALQDSDGVELARELKARQPSLRVVMLSADNSSALVNAAERAGACGYVSKAAPGGMRELLECISEAVNGSGELAADRATLRQLYKAEKSNVVDTSLPQPSPREQDVLRVLLAGANTSNRWIAQQLSLSTGTVQTHMENLFRKFEVSSRSALVLRAVQEGWRERLGA